MVEEGAHVLALDRDLARMDETLSLAQKAAQTSGGSIEAMACDVTVSDGFKACVDHAMARWGRIDVLVNNVGGSAAGGPVEMSEAVWDAQIDHNLKSVFLGCKHVLPIMAAQGAGAIVNIASTSGMRWTGAAQVAYAATKAGVIQLGKVVAVQYAKQGIRVNTVVPGQLHTPMVETRLAGQRAGGAGEVVPHRGVVGRQVRGEVRRVEIRGEVRDVEVRDVEVRRGHVWARAARRVLLGVLDVASGEREEGCGEQRGEGSDRHGGSVVQHR
jgi:NAD(P)-dependent dehydrogenase (short-subunit alcohol dehydrogenase family)